MLLNLVYKTSYSENVGEGSLTNHLLIYIMSIYVVNDMQCNRKNANGVHFFFNT